jgi:hypothetical protein
MMKLSQASWIETFVEGVTDKITGLSIFKDLVWIVYKVSGVMCASSVCENCWSIEGWIHSKRRNKLHQIFVEKLIHTHTNLVLSKSLDDSLHHLFPWDIEFIIDEPVDEPEEEPEVYTLCWWNTLNHKIPKVCVQRERKRQIGTHFFSKKIPSKK